MASTASLAKWSLCDDRILELSVVRAMLNRSSRNAAAVNNAVSPAQRAVRKEVRYRHPWSCPPRSP